MDTEPQGADVSWKGYGESDRAWETPRPDAHPGGPPDQRAESSGSTLAFSETGVRAGRRGPAWLEVSRQAARRGLRAEENGLRPRRRAGECRGQARSSGRGFGRTNKNEVTNRQFQAFVDAGGYRKPH